MHQTTRKMLFAVLGILLCAGVIQAGRTVYTMAVGTHRPDARYEVILDPGHGGIDPGKIGINNVYEKDINLAICFQLKEILEQNDCHVQMLRTADEGLYQPGDTNKKMADLRKRCERINESAADVVVSIHQNSFSQESSHGAQVFYQASSEQGKALAGCIQQQMISSLDRENKRQIKANQDYYMLKNTQKVMVIVECGFLSNVQEAQLLTQEAYQRRVAWAVALGTMQWLGTLDKGLETK